jgi:hypothetical protein
MIIIEGPDGSGKSTLIQRLAKDLGLPIADKVVDSSTKALTDLARWTEDNVEKGFQPLIFDRHRLISEPIYGPATRARQDLKFLDLGWLADMMWRFYQAKPLIVYCLPDLETVRVNVHKVETDNAAVASRIAAIYAGYVARSAADFTRGVGKLYNYRTTRYDEILQWLHWGLQDRLGKGYRDHDRPFVPGQLHRQ